MLLRHGGKSPCLPIAGIVILFRTGSESHQFEHVRSAGPRVTDADGQVWQNGLDAFGVRVSCQYGDPVLWKRARDAEDGEAG